MQRKRLGSSALEVSAIGLGTMTWGERNTATGVLADLERLNQIDPSPAAQ